MELESVNNEWVIAVEEKVVLFSENVRLRPDPSKALADVLVFLFFYILGY